MDGSSPNPVCNNHSIPPVELNHPIPPGTVLTNGTIMGVYSAPVIFLLGINSLLLAQGGGTYKLVFYTGTGNAYGENRHSEIWLQKATVSMNPATILAEGATNTTEYYCLYNTLFNGSSFVSPPDSATNNSRSCL